MNAHADDRRREMDRQMMALLEQHQTVLSNQEHFILQLSHQHDCIESLKREVLEMKIVVLQVGELLAALKGLSTVAKWATALGGGAAILWHGGKFLWSVLWRL